MKLLFVHGTGVRAPGYADSVRAIKSRVARHCPELQVEECLWGDAHGSRLNLGGASIPEYDKTRALVEAPDEDADVVLWRALYDNPLFEIQVLALQAGPPKAFGMANGAEGVRAPLAGGFADADAVKALAPFNLQVPVAQIQAAARWLGGNNEVKSWLVSVPDPRIYAQVLARAVVARVIFVSAVEGEWVPLAGDAAARDQLVEALELLIGGANRGLLGKALAGVKKSLISLAARPPTRYAAARRGKLMDGASAGAGDILLYQVRGEAIRGYIRSCVERINDDVVILAHSLGGVASVDMLIEAIAPNVRLIITAGSQAPLFYEIDALASARCARDALPEERLPTTFPKWLNFYDLRDFLSFIGAGVFGTRVEDIKLDNRQPFPFSHSAYWTNELLWTEAAKRIANL